MNQVQSLAQSLTARMQLGILGTSNTVAHGIRISRDIARTLKDGGGVRSIRISDPKPLRMTGICAMGKRIEAYSGYLYLAAAVRKDVTLHAGQVSYGAEDSVAEIDVMPYGDVRQRIGLKRYAMTYRLLQRLFQENDPPRLIVLDHTLLLPSMFASSDDPDVKREFQALSEDLNALWEKLQPQLSPWTPSGTTIVGLPMEKRLAEPLSAFSKGNTDLAVDAVSPSTLQTVAAQRKVLEDVGAARVMGSVLWPECRSVAFAYSKLRLDHRIEPQFLTRHLDVASFHYRARLRTPPVQIETPGGHVWSSEALDQLAERLMSSTLFDKHDAVPLPIWLGREQLARLNAARILRQYQRATFQVLRSGELDQGWLRGLEPEGEDEDG